MLKDDLGKVIAMKLTNYDYFRKDEIANGEILAQAIIDRLEIDKDKLRDELYNRAGINLGKAVRLAKVIAKAKGIIKLKEKIK